MAHTVCVLPLPEMPRGREINSFSISFMARHQIQIDLSPPFFADSDVQSRIAITPTGNQLAASIRRSVCNHAVAGEENSRTMADYGIWCCFGFARGI
jgi:hypothetical protein